MVTKLKNYHCKNLTQKLELEQNLTQIWQNFKTQTVAKFNNSNCDKTSQLKMWQYSNYNQKNHFWQNYSVRNHLTQQHPIVCIWGTHLWSGNVFSAKEPFTNCVRDQKVTIANKRGGVSGKYGQKRGVKLTSCLPLLSSSFN